jgi:phosphohistidine phosphatase
MKKIILVRHGKAEDPVSGISDFERSLTVRGKIISRLTAKKIRETVKSRTALITSPAFRALETALIFALEFGIDPDKIIINTKLYNKMNIRYLPDILSFVEPGVDTVMLFGHNPSFSEIADSLSREGCDFMPKSGAAGLVFDISTWQGIKQKSGKMEFFLKPEKDL